MTLPEKQYYELENYKHVLKTKDDELYKKCPDKITFVKYLLTLPPIPGLVLPTDELRDESKMYGYKMPFIKNSVNITEYISKPYSIDLIAYIKNLIETLRTTHQYFIIGDIRNANILITESRPYIIDLENGKKLNDDRDLFLDVLYHIETTKGKTLTDSPLSDTIKLFISILSLYYQIDIEKEFIQSTIFQLKDFLTIAKANPYLLDYFNSLINDIIQNKTTPSQDFLQLIDFVKPPSKKEINRLIRTLY